MKDGFNLKTLFSSNNEKDLQEYNYIGDRIILSIFTIFFCIVGLVGNGSIVWLLGFRIRRKPFAIYIVNLAMADFGFLLCLLPLTIWLNPPSFDDSSGIPYVLAVFLIGLLLFMNSSSQLLLTAISIDRWVSVLFPNCCRCRRSPALSTTVCAFIWALSFAFGGMPLFLQLNNLIPFHYVIAMILGQALSILICLLLVMVCTLSLFVKVGFKQCQCGKLLKVILLVLLSFILFTILTLASLIMWQQVTPAYCLLWPSLKCSMNPLIYFLAGGQNGGKFQDRMKAVLQRVFKEERDTRSELQPHSQTLL